MKWFTQIAFGVVASEGVQNGSVIVVVTIVGYNLRQLLAGGKVVTCCDPALQPIR
jgi:hypothetical protein